MTTETPQQRTYIVHLSDVFEKPRTKRAKIGVKYVRTFIAKNMKTKEKNIKISRGINELLFKKGIKKIPRRIHITVVKNKDDDIVSAYLTEEWKNLQQKEKVKIKEKEHTEKTKQETQTTSTTNNENKSNKEQNNELTKN